MRQIERRFLAGVDPMNAVRLDQYAHPTRAAGADLGLPVRLVLAAVAGLLLSAGYSLHPWWWAPFLAPAPLILSLAGSRSYACLAGAIAGAATLTCVFTYYLEMSTWLGMACIAAFRILSWGLIAGLTQFATRRLKLGIAMLVLPTAAAALELLTLTVSHDGAAGSLAYSQGDMPVVEQVAALGGVPAVVFLVLLPGSLIGLLLGQPWPRAQRTAALAAFAALFAAFAFFTAIRLAPASPDGVPVTLIATDQFEGIPQDWAAVWATYAPTVNDAARVGGLVVLPEKIAQLDPVQADRAAADIKAAARASRATIILGIELHDGAVYRNRAVVADPDGGIDWYDKQRLVTRFEAREVPGVTPLQVEAAGTRLGIAICKDMHIPSIGREYDDAAIMAVPAWDFGRDGWIGARMTALRAVENGYAIARSARGGLIGAYDAEGRMIAEQEVGAGMTVLQAMLPSTRRATAYAPVGDVWGWICVIGVVGLVGWGLFQRTQTPDNPSGTTSVT
jgi:apolipoprotein N-acyltransferase